MMYQDKLVLAIKVHGHILREQDDTVSLPFGSEYSILIKNLNSVRTQVTVHIDGADAAGKLVIAPNSSLELERFIRNDNLQEGNRFKFIERTAQIEQHRGITEDDGLIRVEAWREYIQRFEYPPIPLHHPSPIPDIRRPFRLQPGSPRTASLGRRARPSLSARASSHPPSARGRLSPSSAIGITAPGSKSQQVFYPVAGFPLERHSVVLVLRLRGGIDGIPIQEPITVNIKPECSMCGKIGKATETFCARCGSALQLL